MRAVTKNEVYETNRMNRGKLCILIFLNSNTKHFTNASVSRKSIISAFCWQNGISYQKLMRQKKTEIEEVILSLNCSFWRKFVVIWE